MPFTPPPVAIGFLVRLTEIVEGLLTVLGDRAEARPRLAPFLRLAWVRLEHLSLRLGWLAAEFRAGRLRRRRTGPRGGIRRGQNRRKQGSEPQGLPMAARLPPQFGWLIEAAPEAAAFCRPGCGVA